MIRQDSDGFYRESALEAFPLVHGFTAKAMGNILAERDFLDICGTAAIDPGQCVFMQQVHGGDVRAVTAQDAGTRVPSVDGILFRQTDRTMPGPVLFVRTADCVPLLFADPEAGVIGAAHSGWKGTAAHITRHMIRKMAEVGADPSRILMVIGPHIGPCCYTVDAERSALFGREFTGKVTGMKNNVPVLDLAAAITLDARSEGIGSGHIFANPDLCTYHSDDLFFSYRKTGRKPFGECAGFIGFRQ